jgi:superfamily II DNA or RNA helicase
MASSKGDEAKKASAGALALGTKVLVYGEPGEIQKAQQVGDDCWRYTILFANGQVKTYTSPPTTIELVHGPADRLAAGKFAPEIEFDLLGEALRLSTAYEHERLVSLSSSRINMEPYQVFAVHEVISRFPHRFLIADDTGLGKTIEAGMILEELTARGRADRVLIVTPAALATQWKEELKRAFNRDFVFYDGGYIRELMEKLSPEQNPWDRESRIITKLDLAKRDEIRAQLERTRWDLIIFDEAHKLSAHRYGNKIEETQRYELARTLAERTDSLLLLSATPHNGDRSAFHALLTLLDEYAFPSPESITPSQVARVTIRRTKKEILDEQGRPVFVDRRVQTLPVEFSPEESELYKAVTAYVAEGYNLARAQRNNTAGFLMVLFQKRMVSSIEAIRRSLERRLHALEELRRRGGLEGVPLSPQEDRALRDYLEDPDSLSDQERESLERRLEGLPVLARVDVEIATLQDLCEMARRIRVDSKARTLVEFLRGIFASGEKAIVFTEYRDTLHYLERLAAEQGWKYTVIHGEMPMPARRESQRVFEEPTTHLLLATDAAGEGLNLHWSCHLMVNYELPWNPNRIEQRIGRLHRYGQKREVRVHNLFVTNTREDRILERLIERIERIKNDVPGEVSDVLGLLLGDLDLEELIMNALAENRPPEATADQAARAAEERTKMLQLLQEDLFMDVRRYDHERALSVFRNAHRISATTEDLRRLADGFLLSHGAKIRPTAEPGMVRITDVPLELQRPGVRPSYERATFDRAVARRTRPEDVDFIAFGHPLFDAIVDKCRRFEQNGIATIKRVSSHDLTGTRGILVHFALRFTDGQNQTVRETFHPIFLDQAGQPRPERVPAIPLLANPASTPPEVGADLCEFLGQAPHLIERALKLAKEAARDLEDQVQEERTMLVRRMSDDLNNYATVKEAQTKARLAEARSRLREVQEQISRASDEGERRRLEATLHLREYDLHQAESELDRLKAKVQRRREELGNMEIVVAEEPKLVSVAVVEFVPPEGG